MRPSEPLPFLEFVRLPVFLRTAAGVVSEEDLRALEAELVQDPERGDRVVGACGVRKVRVAQEGRGKRGSARVVYLFQPSRSRIYLLFAYAKNRKQDLTPDEKKAACALVAMLNAER